MNDLLFSDLHYILHLIAKQVYSQTKVFLDLFCSFDRKVIRTIII